MTHIIHITNAKLLHISEGRMCIENHDDTTQEIGFVDVSCVVVEKPHCMISASFMLECTSRNIPLIVCDEKYQPVGHVLGLYDSFQMTARLSVQQATSEETKEMLWNGITQQKIRHQMQMLQHIEEAKGVEQLQVYINNINEGECNVQNQEAIAARVYFQALFTSTFKRFADDAYNAGLNYGYMVIRALIMTKLVAKGLHPSIGLGHASQQNTFNLADDIIEVFRPMVDYIVYTHPPQSNHLTKEERQRLLLVLTQNVYWDEKPYQLGLCIEYYIDHIIKHMSGEDIPLIYPELRITSYAY